MKNYLSNKSLIGRVAPEFNVVRRYNRDYESVVAIKIIVE